jgi:hypothetical protein
MEKGQVDYTTGIQEGVAGMQASGAVSRWRTHPPPIMALPFVGACPARADGAKGCYAHIFPPVHFGRANQSMANCTWACAGEWRGQDPSRGKGIKKHQPLFWNITFILLGLQFRCRCIPYVSYLCRYPRAGDMS